jgi:solute carrier family 25 carnitine/acylcarnitine transporter 20/29
MAVLFQEHMMNCVVTICFSTCPSHAAVAAFNALLFTSWGAAERVLSPDGQPLSVSQAMLAGGLAGVPVSLLATPTELLKCR